jgi:hypothetical protein
MLTHSESMRGGQAAKREVPFSTGSPLCLELAKKWINDCERGHKPHCHPKTAIYSFRPIRLLEVGDMSSSVLYLRDFSSSSSNAPEIKYLALSHCWGIDCISKAQKLTKDKKFEWSKTGIDEKLLPLNFQHTISFTRQVGVGYLWIDSLYIAQDDDQD